ncbi:dipeptide epimerase [Nitrospira sp.]|nr:dipeptide epimerase [Nitrospira sp.]
MPEHSHRIQKVELWPIDVPITDPFVVATGSRVLAQNALVRVTLADGTEGYGEMAPFPEVGGETRDTCLVTAETLAKSLLGRSSLQYRTLSQEMTEQAPAYPAVRCGLETAVLDALSRSAGIPLWSLWGGANLRPHETDITIPIADAARTMTLARHWYAQGFRQFKMKVGHDVDEDIRRLEAVHRACEGVSFIVDANQGYTRAEAVAIIEGLRSCGGHILLLEQPLPREDVDGMAALRHGWRVPVAADESVRTLDDLHTMIHYQAADFINIKITKTGVMAAMDIAIAARTAGLHLMIGGMIETRIAMGCSFGLALGLGGFEVLDLDTPLLLASDPVTGGYQYEGPRLLPWNEPGLGLRTQTAGLVTTVA